MQQERSRQERSPPSVHESRCLLHPAWTRDEIWAVWQMKAVMNLLPTGNVTVTHQNGLRRAHHGPGSAHAHTGMFAVQSVMSVHIQADMSAPAPADTFTYEPGCRCPGRDAG